MRRPQTSDHGAQCTPEMQLRDTSFRERGILRWLLLRRVLDHELQRWVTRRAVVDGQLDKA
jgi:hypothetical protein